MDSSESNSCYKRNIKQQFEIQDDLKKLIDDKENEELANLLQEAPKELREDGYFRKCCVDICNSFKDMKTKCATFKKEPNTQEPDSSALAAPADDFFEKLWKYITGGLRSLFQMVWDNIKALFTAIKDFFANIFGYCVAY